MTVYVHYSREENLTLDKLLDTTPQAVGAMYNFKPTGLWISHDEEDGWLDWCTRADFGTGEYRHEVEIADNGLIWLTNKRELTKFNDEYKIPMSEKVSDLFVINWSKLFYEYNGVMIFPYIWETRLDMDFFWYYGWDCASGCIWRPSEVVKSIKRVPVAAFSISYTV